MRVTRRAFSRSRFTRTFFGIPAVREHSRIRGVCKYRWRLERKVDTTTSNFRRSARKRKKHTAARNKITGCYERPVEKPSPRERERERTGGSSFSTLRYLFAYYCNTASRWFRMDRSDFLSLSLSFCESTTPVAITIVLIIRNNKYHSFLSMT